MENQLSYQQSFQIIKQTISQARMRFEQSGLLFVFWGLVIAGISFGYYFLRKSGVEKAYLINLLYLVAAIFTFVYYFLQARKKNEGKNFLARLIGWMWLIININIFVSAFAMVNLGMHSTFVILLLISIGYLLSAIIVRSWILVIASVLLNIGSYITLFLSTVDDLLIFVGVVGLVCIFLPGVFLEIKRRKQ